MIFYLSVFIFFLLLFFSLRDKAYLPLVVLMLLLACLRSSTVGSDFPAYVRLINSGYYDISLTDVLKWYASEDFLEDRTYGSGAFREFGFSFLISFFKFLFKDPVFILNSLILLIITIFSISFYKILGRKEMVWGLLFYYGTYLFFSSFNTIRQSLAVSLVFMGACFFFKHRYIGAITLLLSAVTVHSSSLLVLPLFLLSKIKLPNKVIVYSFVISLVISLFRFRLDFLFAFLPDSFAGNDYESNFYKEGLAQYNVYIHYMSFVFNLYTCYIFYWFYTRTSESYRFFYNLWYVGILLYILLMSAANVGRISEFFYVFLILAIPLSLIQFRDTESKEYQKAFQLAMVYLIGWHSYYIFRNWCGIVPYISF